MEDAKTTREKLGNQELSAPEDLNKPTPQQSASQADLLRPSARSYIESFEVGDELLLLPVQGDRAYALNASGRVVWGLCDGKRSLQQIHQSLINQFDGDPVNMFADLTAALFKFQSLDLLEPSSLYRQQASNSNSSNLEPVTTRRASVRIVHGIEDRAYFHWQLAIMFESLVGQMPPGWDISIVVCNNHKPISAELEHILNTYDVKHYTGESHADNHSIDFAGGGDRYVAINRVEALNIISRYVAPDDVVCLMDTDIFLCGDLQEELFPHGNAMASNWIIAQERYFQFAVKDDQNGLSLPKLLEALGCETEFKPGGVMVFFTGESLQNNDYKLVRDCFRFLQILYLCGKILDLPVHGVWVAEMACFALATYPNGVEYELLEIDQFAVQDQSADVLPEGSFFHYYSDVNDSSNSPGPFHQSAWHKQLFGQTNFLNAGIESFLEHAQGAAEKRFMTLAIQARERLFGHE